MAIFHIQCEENRTIGFAANAGCVTLSHQSEGVRAPGRHVGSVSISAVQPDISSFISMFHSPFVNVRQIKSVVKRSRLYATTRLTSFHLIPALCAVPLRSNTVAVRPDSSHRTEPRRTPSNALRGRAAILSCQFGRVVSVFMTSTLRRKRTPFQTAVVIRRCHSKPDVETFGPCGVMSAIAIYQQSISSQKWLEKLPISIFSSNRSVSLTTFSPLARRNTSTERTWYRIPLAVVAND